MKSKKQKRTFKMILILLTVAALLSVYMVGFISVNSAYPQSQRNYIPSGETFETQEVEVTLIDAELINQKEIIKDKDIMTVLDVTADQLREEDLYLTVVEAEFKNQGNQTARLDLTAFHLETSGASFQFFYPLMVHYNDTGMVFELEPGGETTLQLPVPIFKVSFSQDKWRRITEQKYFIVYSLYPEKNMAGIKFR